MKIIIATSISLIVSFTISSLAEPPHDRTVVLLEINDLQNKTIRWRAEASRLTTVSSWNPGDRLPLSLEDALAKARKIIPDQELDYVELRRPLEPVGNVFFYFFAFSDSDVIILLNGDQVEPSRTTEKEK